MKTLYRVSQVNPKGKTIWAEEFDNKDVSLKTYQHLYESYKEENFKVSKVTILEETIAQSDDYRQAKFDF